MPDTVLERLWAGAKGSARQGDGFGGAPARIKCWVEALQLPERVVGAELPVGLAPDPIAPWCNASSMVIARDKQDETVSQLLAMAAARRGRHALLDEALLHAAHLSAKRVEPVKAILKFNSQR